MAHGRAENSNTPFVKRGSACTPGLAKDRPVLLDAMACMRILPTASSARAMLAVFLKPIRAAGFMIGGATEPCRAVPRSLSRAARGAGGFVRSTAPSHATAADSGGERAKPPLAAFSFATIRRFGRWLAALPSRELPVSEPDAWITLIAIYAAIVMLVISLGGCQSGPTSTVVRTLWRLP